MSGASRKSQYRKHLTDQVLNEFPEPNFDANEHIAQILASRGGNLYEVDIGKDGEELAMLPAKFNKLVWVKRGDFVIVQGEQEATENEESGKGNKVRFLIKHVLYKEQVKFLRGKDYWPSKFHTQHENAEISEETININNVETDKQNNEDIDMRKIIMQSDHYYDDSDYEEVDDDYLINTNRISALRVKDSSESDSE